MPGSTLTLRVKLTAMTLATIIALVVLFVFLLIDGKQRMMLDRQDKVRNHSQAGAEYIVSADSSCLLHQQGCAERMGLPVKFIHIAQILNGDMA